MEVRSVPKSLAVLEGLLPQLNAAERRVAEYLLQHASDVIGLSITELADRSQASEATVVRLSRRLGCRGYQDLKIRIAQEIVEPARRIHEDVVPGDDPASATQKVFASTIAALQATLDVMDPGAMERAADAIHRSTEVVFFGVGGAAFVAADAAQRFVKLGLLTQALSDSHAQAVKASLMRPGSVAVGISHSGSTKATVQALELARRGGATTICVTSLGRSPITRASDISLFTSARETAFRTEAMSSRVAQVTLLDALFVLVALRRYEQALANIERAREVNADKRY
ncbi:MurR/RpiR family transcriptional regulator [Carboxydochorda subterranea]|uniref:MurR/RpiR family transcriptional regulator n=1 Tax=Carboxydichorda subterranea TaxID=3109565 RepID=A0ABZ1BXL9_9FIRM|nr:MurR/RpiR family transcriptional regulator [Limnochorda sp. L945t]WRP17559.1 MurR/RpiR family transcriptional regulator [Limnochorda sp. L945t]